MTSRRVGLAVCGATAALALALAATASAHDIATPSGHAAEDAVTHSAAAEQRMNQQTLDASKAPARAAAAATPGTAADIGQWGPVVAWPVIAINAALLPNGKVLAYDSIGDHATETYPVQDHTRATVWDPSTGSQTDVQFNLGPTDPYNIFCSGFAHLTDGRLFIAGGNKDQQLNGLDKTTYFNPDTNQWSRGPTMAAGRWYPTVTALNNGEQLITSGGPLVPEVRQNDGTLRSLPNASLGLPLYPWFDVAPDGRAFYSGPDPTLRSLDPKNTGSWQTYPQPRDAIDRSYGGHAFFDIGKELVAGGGPSSTSAKVIDVTGTTPTVSDTAAMAFGRRQHNLTVLADGTVLATGGNSSGAGLVDLNAGVYNAELWSPATGTWRTLAAMQVTRQYHSTALLLPDGRVLSAGGGICGTCDQVNYVAKNAEIFSPPYLFDGAGNPATRPTISVQDSITYGQPFQVNTPDPASIGKLALVRLGAVTHSVNMEQRYVPLTYTAGSSALNVAAPANANIAPPGYYMLFAIDSNGVPSIARFVRVDNPAPSDTTPPAVPSSLNATPGDGQVALNWSANGESDLDHYNVYRNSSKIASPTNSSYTDNGLTNGTTYSYAVTAVDKAGNESAKSDSASATPRAPTNQPPTVKLTLPANGATFTGPTKIDLAATASDTDGTVSSVSFYNGSSLIATDTTASYTGKLNVGAATTTLTLTARATDNRGATTTSSSVTINVKKK